MECYQESFGVKGCDMGVTQSLTPERLKEEWLAKLVPFWLLIMFLFSFQLFEYLPFAGGAYLAEIPVLLFLGLFVGGYYSKKLYGRQVLSRIEILLACLLCLPLLSAFLTWLTFGQPILIGFLAERRWFRAIAGLFAFQMLLSRHISWKMLQRIFLLLAFGSLVAYLAMWLFLNPESLAGGLVFMDVLSKGMRLRIVPVFVIWGAIYFALACRIGSISMGRLASGAVAVIMTGYVVFIYKSRATILVLAGVLFLMTVMKTKRGRRIRAGGGFCLLVLAILCGMFLARPKRIQRQLSGFATIASSLYRGDGEMDASLANRFAQGTVAWWSISRSARTFLFGNGRLSRRWESELSQSLGYFYPMDIGWLGIVFLYGFLGFALVNVSFLMAWNLSRKNTCRNEDIFLDSLKWWLVYLFFRSVFNGVVVANPALVLVPLFLISWRCRQNTQDSPMGNEKECEL